VVGPAVQLAQRPVGAQVDLLAEVLGDGAVTDDAQEVVVDPLLVVPYQTDEERLQRGIALGERWLAGFGGAGVQGHDVHRHHETRNSRRL